MFSLIVLFNTRARGGSLCSGVDLGRLRGSLAGGLGAREAGPMAASGQAAAGTQQPQQPRGGEREDEDEPYSSHRRRGNWMT